MKSRGVWMVNSKAGKAMEVNIRKLTEDDRAQFEAAMPSKYVHQLAFHWREFFDSSREMDACLEKESS
jgi:hypothetical protein